MRRFQHIRTWWRRLRACDGAFFGVGCGPVVSLGMDRELWGPEGASLSFVPFAVGGGLALADTFVLLVFQ